MPELPDITVYVERLQALVGGAVLERVRSKSPFLLRSVTPPLSSAHGRKVLGFERLGKRIVFALEGELFLILHLMISGRIHWKPPNTTLKGRRELAAFDFASGSVLLTEASTQQRASLYTAQGRAELAEHDPGGIEPLESSLKVFKERLLSENRTLKRALTDPRLFSGIGNAYSDEILHAARLSPVKLTSKLEAAEIKTLHRAVNDTLTHWVETLRAETTEGLPTKVTAFRPDMAVHGRYKLPCPVCQTLVQRIRYAQNEVNYCPRCQTGGKLLADRSLSRLLRADWPTSIDEWEETQRRVQQGASPGPRGGKTP
jgi:formamidopyrimidine-DNA glycosylase